MSEVSDVIEKILEKSLGKKVDQLGNPANGPVQQHNLTYSSSSETLEPLYFWVLDMMNGFFGGKVEKLVDNFTSSPGGGHFAEMGGRRAIMQKNVSETMGTINTVIKSIIGLIYDLREFKIRLEHYKDSKSDNKEKKQAAMLALKQIWMDNVDIKRGRGAIHAMSQDLNFVTLRDAFLIANSVDEVEKLDLNDRVKRILKPRIADFLYWKDSSEQELQKRFNIEKTYLRSQKNMLQLYSRWVKPYLKAAQDLEMGGNERSPELVKVFNTMRMELTLFGKNKFDVKEAIGNAELPKKLSPPKRAYYQIGLIDFNFRGIPSKIQGSQHYVFGGKVDVSFKAYVMNEEEIALFEEELKKSDLEDAFKLLEGATTESLSELQKDLDEFLGEDKDEKDKKEDEKKKDDSNPFTALISPFFSKKEKKKEKKKIKLEKLKKDNYAEKLVRNLVAANSKLAIFTIYDVYKKAHSMASFDSPFE